MIKIVYAIFRRPDISIEDFRTRWMHEHGDLVLRHARDLRIVRYLQTLHTPHPLEQIMAASRGLTPNHPDGMAELFWENQEDLDFSFSDKNARAVWTTLLQDEKRFADVARSSPWIGSEIPVLNT